MTSMTTRTRLVVLAIVVVAVPPLSGRARLELRARPAFAYAPSELRMEFRIAPDATNRALVVSAESDEFFRSSVIELEGERAPKTIAIEYHGLPAGDYNLRGTLLDGEGDELASVEKQVTVMTSGGEH